MTESLRIIITLEEYRDRLTKGLPPEAIIIKIIKMYMDKKKDSSKAQEDNVGAFFQTCKVNGNNIGCLTVKEFFERTGNS